MREPANLTQHSYSDALGIGYRDQLPQMFDFFVERRSQLGLGDRDGYHFGGLGQASNGIELSIVFVALGVDTQVLANTAKDILDAHRADRPQPPSQDKGNGAY